MNVQVHFFGPLTDLTGTAQLAIDDVASVNELVERVTADFPLLREKKYVIAVDDQITRENIVFSEGARVAFLPPFSGG